MYISREWETKYSPDLVHYPKYKFFAFPQPRYVLRMVFIFTFNPILL